MHHRTYIDADAVDVIIEDRRHLPLLDVSNFAFRIHDKAIHILLPS